MFKTFSRIALAAVLFSTLGANALPVLIPPHKKAELRQPMIMLNLSRDHQLSYRAFNEYSDLDGDGLPETTYKHTFGYYGYFDTSRCYTYAGGMFSPASAPTGVNPATNPYGFCAGAWHGNFMNWAGMTRIDTVRKMLYGGFRSTDTGASTVLERGYLPTDAHSFAKYYIGIVASLTQPPVSSLTPFNETEITICNTTLGASTGLNSMSQTNTNPPIMRVAKGNHALWNANERWQCYWSEEKSAANGNNPALTGLASSSSNPSRASSGLVNGGNGPDFIARVEVCKTGFIGKAESCKQYPDGNYKPTGLLHEYGETGNAEFGLMTGSWSKNISGGVLRANMGDFANEINTTTDGTFKPTVKGIAFNIDRIRINNYEYDQGYYNSGGKDNCPYQLTGLVEGGCTSWGNPLGAIFIDSIRYLAGKTSPSVALPAGSYDSVLGLTSPAWVDPFLKANAADRTAAEAKYGRAECRRPSVINFNASVSSYDSAANPVLANFADLNPSGFTLAQRIDAIGAAEGVNGTKKFFVGRNGTAADNNLCTAKTVTGLASVDGLCPDAPAYRGGYALAGAAYHAHVTKIRTDITTTNPEAFKVNTFGVALTVGAPRIKVNAGGKLAIIQPAYQLRKPGGQIGGGTLVDFRVVSQTATSGKYIAIWEDSEQGGDYDQDASGILEWNLVGDVLSVSTFTFAAATANGQGFGYTISGTVHPTTGLSTDGVHFHSGILGFTSVDPTNILVTGGVAGQLNASGGCALCNVNQSPTTATYTVKGTTDGVLEDPLWYAAKWGGFKRGNTNSTSEVPTALKDWDDKNTKGVQGADGIPDNYFYSIDPSELAAGLRSAIKQAADTGVSAPTINSTLIAAGSTQIEVKYDPKDASGEINGFIANASGDFAASPTWRAHLRMTNPAPGDPPRQIITNEGATGKLFLWTGANSISTATQTLLNTNSANVVDGLGEKRLKYIRGERGDEAPTAGGAQFRTRNPDSIVGSIVNSAAWVMGRPASRIPMPSGDTSYATFAATNKNRDQIGFVAANDGLLHAQSPPENLRCD
jgi:type IV pilus assembly protein PilY1